MNESPTSTASPRMDGAGHTDLASFPERLHALRAALEAAAHEHRQAALSGSDRESLKQQIIVLFREADAALQQAQAWKEAVKGMAEQWKQLGGAQVKTSATGGTGATARVDHLGASTFVEKGWSRLSLLDVEGAELAFRRALELAPASSETETLLAWALMLQQRYDEAQRTLVPVLQRDPQYPLAHATLGYIALRTGRHQEAIAKLSAVTGADNDRRAVLYAHLYLGMTYAETANYDTAEMHLRRALELGPNLLQAWYELGRTLWWAGRSGDARLAWKTGSEANKFSPWGKRCAELLQVVEQGGEPPRAC